MQEHHTTYSQSYHPSHQHQHTDPDPADASTHHHDDAAEAVLASLRAVINDNDNANDNASDGSPGGLLASHHEQHQQDQLHQHDEGTHSHAIVDQHATITTPATLNAFVPVPLTSPTSTPTTSTPDKLLASLNQIIKDNQLILEAMNSPGAIHGLADSLKGLGEGNEKLAEIAKGLTAQFRLAELSAGLHGLDGNIDPSLVPSSVVLRTEYDDLKARYDELLTMAPNNTPGKRGGGRKPRVPKSDANTATSATAAAASSSGNAIAARRLASQRVGGDGAASLGGAEGRKKRSIKLEHLVHKMANRRLGVEYQVSHFECKGTRDLPDPASEPPRAAESVNGVDEYRPHFSGDVDGVTVRPFIDRVVEDVVESWDADIGADEPDVDRERIVSAVNIYWTRLVKRYDEQQHRERGEIHRDELSRRKQNTYRRQQSLLARRLATFDASPLNMCKLRALYRTLLTIDFAAQTQDSPDPKRHYTVEEWNAYRKAACGSRADEAHEVIDQFWLSANARALLNILDVYFADQTAKSRRKGRPKQPNPTFHLPSELWDRSNLPVLRPKDPSGLPISGAQGIILFRFHVDEQVQTENPDWASGLYDNPPIPEEDASLPSLPEVMASPMYAELKPLIKTARELATPKRMSEDEVKEVNDRIHRPEDAIQADQAILDDPSIGSASAGGGGVDINTIGNDGDYMTFAALSKLAANDSGNGNGAGHVSGNIDPSLDGIGQSSLAQNIARAQVNGSGAGTVNVASSASASASAAAAPISSSSSSTHSPYALHSSFTTAPASASGVAPVTGENAPVGPSPGSSMRARKLGKRTVSEVPGGAATPVPKRMRSGGTGSGIGVALGGGGGGGSGNDTGSGGAGHNQNQSQNLDIGMGMDIDMDMELGMEMGMGTGTGAGMGIGTGLVEVEGDLNGDAAFLEGL